MDKIKSFAAESIEIAKLREETQRKKGEMKIQHLFDITFKMLEDHVKNPDKVNTNFKSNIPSCYYQESKTVRKKFHDLGFKTKDELCYCSGPTCCCRDFIITCDQWTK